MGEQVRGAGEDPLQAEGGEPQLQDQLAGRHLRHNVVQHEMEHALFTESAPIQSLNSSVCVSSPPPSPFLYETEINGDFWSKRVFHKLHK